MTLLYYDPVFLEHDTGQHPENRGRLTSVMAELEGSSLDAACRRVPWPPASPERIGRVHSPQYIEHLQQVCAAGGGRIEQDTVVSSQSYTAACLAAGAVCDAVARVVAGEDSTALCLVRPPGHHALPSQAMGFCLLNHVAIAARVAIDELDLQRVMIVDWDVHHGNGTQDIFWEEPRVGFLSIHRWPFYPGTGRASETGGGPGEGTTCNLPVAFGTSREEYFHRFSQALEDFAERLEPQLVLVSAGFDAHQADPIGSLGLNTQDFRRLTQIVSHMAHRYAEGRVVSSLEGGYSPSALAESTVAHLDELLAGSSGNH